MWFDSLPADRSWAALWYGYVLCECHGIRTVGDPCPACGAPPYDTAPKTITVGDQEVLVGATFMGAEGRYEDWVFLQMLESEWKRPLSQYERFETLPVQMRPSSRAAFAIIFWSYFETKIERLLRESMRTLPEGIMRDTLSRYSGIGARLDRLYSVLFKSTYWRDLEDLGYVTVALMLERVQKCRNDFVHGMPNAINDDLIAEIASRLQSEHEAWIAVYNLRVSTHDAAKNGDAK